MEEDHKQDREHPLLSRLAAAEAVAGRRLAKPEVDLLLGNDREIGRAERSQEKRAGITPLQVRQLAACLKRLEVRLNVFVVQGAGQRAGYSDADYIAAGAEILSEAELEQHDRAPDVVHALKEPSSYESRLPGPFCRIGALHSGNFAPESGLARLLETRDVAVFDGSNVGAPGAWRIPIRGRMSEFAGEIAHEWIAEHLRAHGLKGRAVVVGGGRAGLRAAARLCREPQVEEVHVFELEGGGAGGTTRAEQVRARVARLPQDGQGVSAEQAARISVHELLGRDDVRLLASLDKHCVAVVFAVAKPGEKAPKVVHVDQLPRRLAPGAVVVDISIDERGAIDDPAILPAWDAEKIIPHLEHKLAEKGLRYLARANMPRSQAREATKAHGEVVLPYLAALLWLCALEHGPRGALRRLGERAPRPDAPEPASVPDAELFDALCQDLRNGLAFHTRVLAGARRRLVVEGCVADRVNLLPFLLERPRGHEIAFECPMPPRAALSGNAEREAEAREAISKLPKGIRSSLETAFEKGVACTLLWHPEIDGRETEDAARALGVDRRHVLKTLLFERPDGKLVAAVCGGDRHVDAARLAIVAGVAKVKLAEPARVLRATHHAAGGVPTLELFALLPGCVFVAEELLGLERVYASAGSEYFGLSFAPEALRELGGVVAGLTRPPTRLMQHEREIRQRLEAFEKALHRDHAPHAEAALRALDELVFEEGPVPRSR